MSQRLKVREYFIRLHATSQPNLMPGEEEDVDNHLARFVVARQTQFNPKHKPFRGALGVLPSEVQLVTIPW